MTALFLFYIDKLALFKKKTLLRHIKKINIFFYKLKLKFRFKNQAPKYSDSIFLANVTSTNRANNKKHRATLDPYERSIADLTYLLN